MLSRQEEEWDFGVDLVEAVELRHALLASMQIGMQDGVASEFAYLDGASSVDHDCFSQDGEWVEVRARARARERERARAAAAAANLIPRTPAVVRRAFMLWPSVQTGH
eukprot:7024384-Prymnesium_polylepis.1